MYPPRPYQLHKIPLPYPIFISMICMAIFLMTPLFFKLGLVARDMFGLSQSLTQVLIYLSPMTAVVSGVLCWLYWRDNHVKGFVVSSMLLPTYWVASFYLTTQVQL